MKRNDLFWGLLFILAAALIIVNQFGIFAGVSMFDIVLTIILAGIIIKSMMRINFWGILFPLALIGIIYAKEFHITHFTPWPILFTALLLCIGLSMIFKRPFNHFHHYHHDHSFSNVRNEQDDNVVNCTASFGECLKYINSPNFERADIKCSFGSVKAYFDHAMIPSGKADIYLEVSFGEAELYIPRSWKVVNEANVFLGDMDERHRNNDITSCTVTIHGNVSFGDVKIIYV